MKINPAALPQVPALSPEEERLSPEERTQLRQVARQFESVFVNQMVGAMRKTVTPGGWMPESQGEKVYKSMLDSEYSDKLSQSDQLGLSQLIYEHLLRTSGPR